MCTCVCVQVVNCHQEELDEHTFKVKYESSKQKGKYQMNIISTVALFLCLYVYCSSSRHYISL